MTIKEIDNKIEENRRTISRMLNSDVDLFTKRMLILDLSDTNEWLLLKRKNIRK